jgi:tetratricopeptide (TPR) repeat protein
MGARKKFTELKSKISSLPKARVAVVIMAVIVLAAGTALAVPRIQTMLKHRQEERAEQERIKNLSPSDLQSAIDDAILQSDLDKAAALIKQNKEHQSKDNLIMLAMIYMGQKDYSKALDTLQLAENAYGLDSSLALNIAQVKVLQDDKQAAIDYYQKAIEALKRENAAGNAESIQDIEAIIAELQK